ncbi:MAG TPA: hypothetical protein VLZ06_02340 [Solirubrobacteraceae bacterium]|nr:hypothetical protein [Solirubrobacteraceae bacterium]
MGISKTATSAEAQAAYHQAFAAAIASGQEQAEFIAGEVNAKVASIQQIVPRGGSIECSVPGEEGTLREYEPYDGATPNFVSVQLFGGYAVAPLAASKPATHAKSKKKKKHKHHASKAAVAPSCELSARVVLSYLLT